MAAASRSLISVFRELAPGMLEKRDRGRGANASATLKAYGASSAVTRIPGADLLQAELVNVQHHVSPVSEDSLAVGSNSEQQDNAQEGPVDAAERGLNGTARDERCYSSGCKDEEDQEHKKAEAAGQSVGDEDTATDDSNVSGAEGEQDHFKLYLEEISSGSPAQAPAAQHHSSRSKAAGNMLLQRSIQIQLRRPPKRKLSHEVDSIAALKRQLVGLQDAKCSMDLPPASASSPTLQPSAAPATAVATAPLEVDSVPLEYERFLTKEDFERIRELRQQQLVDAAMAKHGLKSAAKRAKLLVSVRDEADAALEALVSSRAFCTHWSLFAGLHKSSRPVKSRYAPVWSLRCVLQSLHHYFFSVDSNLATA